jgi:hypothetical protein
MAEPRKFSLMKPTIRTPFRIDFDWWQENENDWHVHLSSLLCDAHQQMFLNWDPDQYIDWVDPVTAEVVPMDSLQQVLMSHCAKEPDFLTDHTTLVDGVFRVLLSTGNTPASSEELGAKLGKQPDTILKTISSGHVYKGIRPVLG